MSSNLQLNIIVNAVDRASSTLGSVGNSVSGLGQRFSGLKDVVKTAAGFITGMFVYDALGELQRGIRDSIDAFIEFESTLADIQIASGLSADAFQDLKEELMAAASSLAEYGVNINEALQATEALVKAGLSGADAVEALTGAIQLAKLEGLDYARASELLIQIMNQFNLSASEATRVVDVLVNASIAAVGSASDLAVGLSYAGTIASQLGFTLEETTAALVALNNAGLEAGRAGRNLQAMFSDLIEKSDKLGFSIYDTSGRLLPLSEIIDRLVKHLQNMATEEERNAYLMDIFGQQGMRAATILLNLAGEGKSAGEVLRELAAQVGRAGTASEAMGLKMETTQGKLARLSAEFENFKLGLGGFLADVLLKVIDGLRWLAGILSETLAPIIQNWIMPAVQELTSAWNEFTGAMEDSGIEINVLVEAVKILAVGFSIGLGYAIKIIAAALRGLAELIRGIIWVVNQLRAGWESDWMGIRTFFETTVAVIVSIINGLIAAIQWISDRVNEVRAGVEYGLWLIKNAFEFYSNLVNTIWTGLWNGIQWIAESIGNAVYGFIDYIMWSIKNVFDFFGGDIWNIWNNLWNSIKDIVSNALNWVINKIKDVFGSITGFFNQLWQAITGGSIWTDMWRDIKDIAADYGGETEKIISQWTNRLKTQFTGLKQDINVALEGGGRLGGPSTLGRQVVFNVSINVSGVVDDPEELAEAVSRKLFQRVKVMI